jgi:V/A-type H+-transporting ATPase subunit F
MYKAAAIGHHDSIYGFASAGMDIIPVENEQECIDAFLKTLKDNYGVVFVTENFAETIHPLITQPLPAVMFIPSQEGSKGFAMTELHSMVEKAAGADLLRNS